MNHSINGQQLLSLRPEDLEHLGVLKLGHQEIILEAVEYLRNFHFELDRENLQLLALRLSCQAHSLHNELSRQTDSKPVTTQTLSDVASVVMAVKPLVRWLDRSPFSGQLEYNDKKAELMKLSLEMATCAQRDRFAEKPIEEIRTTCGQLARLADYIIQDIADPMILQPASLDLATLKKKSGDDLVSFQLLYGTTLRYLDHYVSKFSQFCINIDIYLYIFCFFCNFIKKTLLIAKVFLIGKLYIE